MAQAARCVGRQTDSPSSPSEPRAASSSFPSLLFFLGAGSHFGKLSPTDLVFDHVSSSKHRAAAEKREATEALTNRYCNRLNAETSHSNC